MPSSSSPTPLLVALVIGWLLGRCDTEDRAALRQRVLEEVRASEARTHDNLTALASRWASELDAHEAREQVTDRAARFDLFCIATHPRGMAVGGYRYIADWSWVACRERY